MKGILWNMTPMHEDYAREGCKENFKVSEIITYNL